MSDNLTKKLRELCPLCMTTLDNRSGKLTPHCLSCLLKHEAAEEIELLNRKLVDLQREYDSYKWNNRNSDGFIS